MSTPALADTAPASAPPSVASTTPNATAPAPAPSIDGATKETMSNGVVAPNPAPVVPAAAAAPPAPAAPAAPKAKPAVNSNGKRELSPDRTGPPSKSIKQNHGADAKGSTPGSPEKEKEKTKEEKEKEEKDRERREKEKERKKKAKERAKERERLEKEAKEKEAKEAKEKEKADKAAPGGLLPMGRGHGIDMRAEEEAQRKAVRSNVGGAKFAGSSSRARQTDLFGEQALKARLAEMAQQHKMTVDDEAMRYLALAAEIRVRTLLTSAIRAQQHRVTSTHQHRPPMSKTSVSSKPQALWSQKITSDPHAVMVALTNANRDENKAHRVARTERNARETEMARAVAIQRERDGGEPAPAPPSAEPASSGPTSDGGGESSSAPTPRPPIREPVIQAAPTFGSAPPPSKRSGKNKKAAARDVSADVQAKITNATALMVAGRKRYAWETGVGGGSAFRPNISSPLTGKRKPEEEEAAPSPAAGVAEEPKPPPKRPKRTITGPHRRHVDIETAGDKKGRDDTALTVVDVLFALDHEGSVRGAGSSEDITRRVWSRPGGPYGTGK